MTHKLDDGLYVTTQPLPGADAIGARQLVRVVTLGPGKQALRLPAQQEHLRWRFQDKSHPIRSNDYARTLKPLPAEGLYVTTQPLPINPAWTIPPRSLAHLSYATHGDPILYFARADGPHVHVPAVGYRFSPDVLGTLKAVDFGFAPPPADGLPLH